VRHDVQGHVEDGDVNVLSEVFGRLFDRTADVDDIFVGGADADAVTCSYRFVPFGEVATNITRTNIAENRGLRATMLLRKNAL
jgi:hypothetical protein